MEDPTLADLFERHIKDTPAQGIVFEVSVKLCNLTDAVAGALDDGSTKVHVTSRSLKHMYDKRPAEEFDSILRNLPAIVRSPDDVYLNRSGKKGQFCLVKEVGGSSYFCSLEKCPLTMPDSTVEEIYCVVTCFRLREEKRERYLRNYRPIWSWKGGGPSS